jgi:starch phosphorylase
MTSPLGKVPYLPERIGGLGAIAQNLSWSWSRDARAMFRTIDQPLWQLTRHNPIDTLRRVDPARLAECAEDPEFLKRYDLVLERLSQESHRSGTWFATTHPDLQDRPIAYFCAEFGLHNSVPIYSGGLGVLAGDHCKASSDLGVPLVGVGLLYMRGYFDQRLRLDGWQEAVDETFDTSLTPLNRVPGPGGEPFLTTQTGRPVRRCLAHDGGPRPRLPAGHRLPAERSRRP